MTSLPWLSQQDTWFPDPETALSDPDGLLAVGGDLNTERLLTAYRRGIFPWFSDDQPILWWSPDPRCVLFPEEVHIARSLRRRLNQHSLNITVDKAFPEVMSLCGRLRAEGTWITQDMEHAYNRLHELGYAHSFEAWDSDGELVGGLYGVALGRCFFGESMFSRERDASKVVLVHVCRQLAQWGYPLFDCQVENPHLLSMGARLIPRSEFLSILRKNVDAPAPNERWELYWTWADGG